MKPKVVITNKVPDEVIDLLSSQCDVISNLTEELWSYEKVKRLSKEAEGLMVFMPDRIDDAFLKDCPKLRVIAGALKGYDNFDVKACNRRNIYFTIVPDLLTVPTAELTIALLLGVSRRILEADAFIRSGQFQGWRLHFLGTGLSGKTVGIIGMGAVGQAIAKRLASFEVKILYHDTVSLSSDMEKRLNAKKASFFELLRQSDFVITVVPLTNDTYHLINREALKKIKRGAYLINTGRGSVVDERAVVEALENEHLAGYAADVYEMEDWNTPDCPDEIPQQLIMDTKKTLLVPHIGSAVVDVRLNIALEAARNILQALNGEMPAGAVNQCGTDRSKKEVMIRNGCWSNGASE